MKKPKTIRANRVIIEDLQGRPRILLDASHADTGISITILSKENAEISISMDDHNHGVVSIRHASGKTGVCMAVDAEGRSGVELRDDRGLPSILIASKGGGRGAEVEVQTSKGKKKLV